MRRSNEELESLPESDVIPEVPVEAQLMGGKQMTLRREAVNLLAEAHQLREAETRLKLVKARLSEIIAEEGLEGFRHGLLCCKVRWQSGRKSLDRALLVENGVTPEQLNNSMKEGEPFKVVELNELR